MKITLRVLDGSLQGREFSFDLQEGSEVRVGRDPAKCRMVLPAEYASVSRQHCVLRSVLGRVRLRVNKENPVFVGGAQAWDDSVVRDGAEIRLGATGPRMTMTIAASDTTTGLNSTVFADGKYVPPEQVVQEEAHRTAEELRGHRRHVWVVAGLVASAAVVGILLAIDARAATGRLVAATFSEEQRRSVLELVARPKETKVDMGEVVRAATPSIYCVIDRDGNTARHVGTAWVLDRDAGLVATNSHVAEEWKEGRTFLRAQGLQTEDVPVESASLHPGYGRFGALCRKYADALMLGGGASSKTVVACDVALLTVAKDQRGKLAPALPLVPIEELRNVTSGCAVGSVGFPAEGLAFNVDRPQSRSHIGHVIATSDFFLGPAETAQAQLVHTDLPVTGGASGSPVFDERGRVLGIINAGSFTLGMEGRRIPIAGTTYAQRIDILNELVASDTAAQSIRERTWESAFLAMAANAQKTLEQVLTERFRRDVAGGDPKVAIDVVVRDRTTLAWDGKLAKSEFAFSAKTKGRYLFCAMSDDMENIDVVALLPNGGRILDAQPDWYPCIYTEADAAATVHLTVLREEEKAASVTIFVLRADP